MSDKPIKEYLNTDDIVQIVNTPTSEKRIVIQKKVGPIVKVNKGQPQHIVTNGAPTCRNLSTDSASNCCVNNNIQNIKFDNVQGVCFDKENLPEIENLDLLLDALCDVMIRFDTDPKHYLKDDYFSLIKTLSNSLIHLYLTDSLHEKSIEKINTQLGLVDTKVFALQSDVDKLIENVNNIDETLEDHINDFNNPHRVTKSQVGLSNVDNTSDLEKPISNATKQALDTKVDKEEGKGLSEQNFTQEEKDKLASLHNYDDTALKNAVFSGYVSSITEKMGYDGTNPNFFRLANGASISGKATASGLKNTGRILKSYLTANVSEGLEEVYNIGFERLADKLTGVGYLDQDGKAKPYIMGCYGIGISRTAAAAVEAHYDEHGIKWPIAIAPYHVTVIPVNIQDETQMKIAEEIYEKLQKEGIEVLIDDRDDRAGVKFKDADLIGIPLRITAGKTVQEGLVEYKVRETGEVTKKTPDEAVKTVVETVKAALNK